MIKYTLKCAEGHDFEAWFANADAFDTLQASGHVTCAVCGSTHVEKAVMAPRVSTSKDGQQLPATKPVTPTPQDQERQKVLAQMRAEVEKNATYVGRDFAKNARDMYLGDVPDRPIWGEANAKEAKALIEDGVPVAPLPFIPTRKAN